MTGIDEQIDGKKTRASTTKIIKTKQKTKFPTRNGWEGGVECGRVTQTGGQASAQVDERWAEAQAGGPAGGWTRRQTGGEVTKIGHSQ